MPDEPFEPFDPFTAEPDPVLQKQALLRGLEMAHGFALYFVVCDPGKGRTQLIQEIAAYFPTKRIQAVPVSTEADNLLHLLQTHLSPPAPDAVFVYGLENWISGAVDSRTIPFIRNLNAARNTFYDLVRGPLVFFVARHVLQAIINGAPDFFSVRSGVYVFPMSPEERRTRAISLSKTGHMELLGLSSDERNDHIAETEHLLAEVRSVEESERNVSDEAALLNNLGVAYLSLSRLKEACPFLIDSLAINRRICASNAPSLAISIVNLAGLRLKEENYSEAERLFKEALLLCDKDGNHDVMPTVNGLNGLGELYQTQNRYAEAEETYLSAIKIHKDLHSDRSDNLARLLNNLANVYKIQARYAEAEEALIESIRLREDGGFKGHATIAISLNNLAILYRDQGRFAEAEPLYRTAWASLQQNLGSSHKDTKQVKQNLDNFLKIKAYAEQHLNLASLPFRFKPLQIRRKKK